MPNKIVLRRLLDSYDFVDVLRGTYEIKINKKIVRSTGAISLFTEDKPIGDSAWHAGRIRYFMDLIKAGEKLDPAWIDNECSRSHILAEPIVTDGHHRLIAHLYSDDEHVQVCYSGRIDVLRFLQGRRKTMPL